MPKIDTIPEGLLKKLGDAELRKLGKATPAQRAERRQRTMKELDAARNRQN